MHNNMFILLLCFVFVETVLRRNLQLHKLHIYIHSLFALFFSIDQRILLKLYIHSFCILIISIPKLYGNLALEFDEDHYDSLPVKIA